MLRDRGSDVVSRGPSRPNFIALALALNVQAMALALIAAFTIFDITSNLNKLVIVVIIKHYNNLYRINYT